MWVKTGIVRPDFPAERKGKASGYTIWNLIQFILADDLGKYGIELKTAGAVARIATKKYQDQGKGYELVKVSFDEIDGATGYYDGIQDYDPDDAIRVPDLEYSSIELDVKPYFDHVTIVLERMKYEASRQ